MSTKHEKQGQRRRRRVALAGLMAAQATIAVGWADVATAAPSTERVSVTSAELQANGASVTPAVNDDGNYIAFTSSATNLAGGVSGSQVYLRDKVRGVTEIVSIPSNGGFPNGPSLSPSISSDGRFIAFQSFASNLVSGDTNGRDDVLVHDKLTGTTTRVRVSSSGGQADQISSDPAISGDGRYVAFVSSATNLVSGDTNSASDVFLHDRVARTTTRVSVGTTGVQGNLSSTNPSLSRDGSRIAFQSAAGNLIGGADTNSLTDVFVASRTGVTFRASQSSGGGQADGASVNAAMSGDGRSVADESRATNLVSGDSSGRSDVFHHNLAVPTNRVTTRVVNGVNAREFNDPGNGDSGNPSISHDGAVVAFRSSATNLVSGDANGSVQDVFVADLRAPLGSQNRLASVAFTSGGANGVSAMPALSSNAQVATFGSQATNLVVGDTNGVMDVIARTLQ